MEHAINITHIEAYVGMEFEYSDYSYSKKETVTKIGKVEDIRETKTGRIQLTVSGRKWTNGAVNPDSPLQDDIK